MADTWIAVGLDGAGKKVDNVPLLVGADPDYHYRQVILIGDPTTAAGIAPVSAATGLLVNVSNASLLTTNANLDVALSTRLKPADTLAGVTNVGTIVNPVGVSGIDVNLSTRLKPADTLAGVTTVGAVTSITNPVAVTNAGLNNIPALGQALAGASVPVVLTAAQLTTLTPPAAIAGYALEAGHLAAIDTSAAKIPAQGQAVAAASMPVVLPATQITTLTPPAAITGFALEAGHLATIDSHIPALGQALAAASVPVVLTAIQVAALTPPAAIVGFALEAGHLATIDTSTAKIPAQGQALAAASMPVVLTALQVAALTPPATYDVSDRAARAVGVVSAASLPLPTGAATAANQPIPGSDGALPGENYIVAMLQLLLAEAKKQTFLLQTLAGVNDDLSDSFLN